jgi:hypothetical protein
MHREQFVLFARGLWYHTPNSVFFPVFLDGNGRHVVWRIPRSRGGGGVLCRQRMVAMMAPSRSYSNVPEVAWLIWFGIWYCLSFAVFAGAKQAAACLLLPFVCIVVCVYVYVQAKHKHSQEWIPVTPLFVQYARKVLGCVQQLQDRKVLHVKLICSKKSKQPV